MSTAMQVIQIIFQTVAIIFMICLMFIGIWSFIVFLKMAKNQRIQTYLLEKINKSISALEKNNIYDSSTLESAFMMDDFSSDDTDDDNIIKFDDSIK